MDRQAALPLHCCSKHMLLLVWMGDTPKVRSVPGPAVDHFSLCLRRRLLLMALSSVCVAGCQVVPEVGLADAAG